MRSHLLGLCFGLMIGLSSSPQTVAQASDFAPLPETAQETTTFINEPGRFSVQMPGDRQTTTHQTTIPGGTLDWTLSSGSEEGSVYAVAYTDLPLSVLEMGYEEIIESVRSRPFFDDFAWSAIADSGHRISLGDFPGREFLHIGAGGRFSALRLHLANRRLYVVLASATDLEAVSQFISSFQIASIWRPFVDEAGRFEVHVPMAPVTAAQTMAYRGDRLDWRQFTMYNLMAPGDAYQIAYTDLPASALTRDAATLIDEVANLILTPLEAEEITASGVPISLQGYPGRQYATTLDGKSYVLRFYRVDDRLYGILAGSRSLDNHAEFLNSFQIQPQ